MHTTSCQPTRPRRIVTAMSALSDRLNEARQGMSLDAVHERTHQMGKPLGRSTVQKLLNGSHGPKTSEATLDAIASALGLDVQELRPLVGRHSGTPVQHRMPDSAAALTEQEWQAVRSIIDVIARAKGEDNAAGTAKAEKNDNVRELRPGSVGMGLDVEEAAHQPDHD